MFIDSLILHPVLGPLPAILAAVGGLILFQLSSMLYHTQFSSLRKIPGPWLPAATSLWIRWQRWQGKLSFTADELLNRYGPVVRISPNMVLVNDSPSLQSIFSRQDLDTAPKAIRALRVGGHDWTVTYPQNHVARDRHRPVMVATTTKALRYWQPIFEDYINRMVENLGQSKGNKSEDIVHHLRIATLLNSKWSWLVLIPRSNQATSPIPWASTTSSWYGDFASRSGSLNGSSLAPSVTVASVCDRAMLFTSLEKRLVDKVN